MPSKQIECDDEELFSPLRVSCIVPSYQRHAPGVIDEELMLIDAFYGSNTHYAFCGIKSMPVRHKQFQQPVLDPEIQIITISRVDFISTLARLLLAETTGNYQSAGRTSESLVIFKRQQRQHAANLVECLARSRTLPHTLLDRIDVTLEDFCSPDFSSVEPNRLFARQIQLNSLQAPTHSINYLTNWREFSESVETVLLSLPKTEPDWLA